MEYVQLEGIHIHEDGYAKFIELTLNIMGELNGYGFRIVFACMKKALAEVRKCLIIK